MISKDIISDIHLKIYNSLPDRAGRILDIGCRDGAFIRYLSYKSRFVLGIDFQISFLGTAKENNPVSVNFVNSYAEQLAVRSGVFDYVILAETLEHCRDEIACVGEIRRVLNNGGKLILTVPYRGLFYFLDPDNFKVYFPRIYKIMYRILKKRESRKSLGFSGDNDYHRHYSLSDIESLLKGKLRIVQLHRGGLLFLPLFIWSKYFLDYLGLKDKYILRILHFLSNLDFKINFGRFAYSLFIIASKE